ncbi:hypothetical protein ACLOJK_003663 [Asimina triloba]
MVVQPSDKAREAIRSRMLVEHPSEERVEGERLLSKRRCLVKAANKGIIPLEGVLAESRELFRQEKERWKRANEDQLQMGIALSQKEAQRARVEASSREGSSVMVANAEEEALLVVVAVYEGVVEIGIGATPRAPGPLVEVADPEGSHPWVRTTLKILGNLPPVESRTIWESVALGREPPLDAEGHGPGELMLLKFLLDVGRELRDLEERVCAVHGCSAWVEYQYHVMEKRPPLVLGHSRVEDLYGVSPIMTPKEHRKVVAAGKRLKELVRSEA